MLAAQGGHDKILNMLVGRKSLADAWLEGMTRRFMDDMKEKQRQEGKEKVQEPSPPSAKNEITDDKWRGVYDQRNQKHAEKGE